MSESTTTYGRIFRTEGKCQDDYPNLRVYDQPPEGSAPITLQEAAMKSFKACEEAFAKKVWRPGMPPKVTRGSRVFRPIYLTVGSFRTCETAKRLYESEENQERIRETGSSRYARPESTLHTHGLAIDVHTGYLNKFPVIRTILLNHEWNRSRPEDEPWHFSFHLTG